MGAPADITPEELTQDAVAHLFARDRPRLLALATRMVSGSDAEDVVQDAFVSALRHKDQFRGQAQPSTWIYRVTINAALMKLRTRRRKGAESLESLPPAVVEASLAAPVEVRADAADVAQQRTALDAAIAGLAPVDRRIVRMRFVDEKSTAEVACATGLSLAATKTRLHRARAALRVVLEGQGLVPA